MKTMSFQSKVAGCAMLMALMVVGVYLPASATTAADSFLQRQVKQLGTTAYDTATGVASDQDGNLYVAGYTSGTLTGTANVDGGADIIYVKYTSTGTLVWQKQIHAAGNDYAYALALDNAGYIYIAGSTQDDTIGGNVNIFLGKYSAATGAEIWHRSIGSTASDEALGIAISSNSDTVYLTGYTQGTLGTTSNAGGKDMFVLRCSADGSLNSDRFFQTGTLVNDVARSIAIDASGKAYITGYTEGSFAGVTPRNSGGTDLFIMQDLLLVRCQKANLQSHFSGKCIFCKIII
jgi:hypothetical protein